jgi:hypothetical protein
MLGWNQLKSAENKLSESQLIGLLVFLVMILALASGLYLSSQSQDVRQRASTLQEYEEISPSTAPSQDSEEVIPEGCYYKQVQCFQAPCDPILVCPKPLPEISPAPEGCYYKQVQCFQAPCDPILVCDNLDLFFREEGMAVRFFDSNNNPIQPNQTPFVPARVEVQMAVNSSTKDASTEDVRQVTVAMAINDQDVAAKQFPLSSVLSQQNGHTDTFVHAFTNRLSGTHVIKLTINTPQNLPETPNTNNTWQYQFAINPGTFNQADINKDGFVDLTDYSIMSGEFMVAQTSYLADITGDGIVDLEDFAILNREFGAGLLN